MRKLTLLIVITIVSFFESSAQFEKGQLYGGVSVGTRFIRYTTHSVRPELSYSLSKHSTIGVFYDYTKYRSWSNFGVKGTGNSFSVGVSYDYYHYFKNSTKWGWYVNATLGYMQTNFYEKGAASSPDRLRFNEAVLSITPGIFYKPSERLMFFGNIGGLSLNHYNNGVSKHTDFNSAFASQINVGVRLTLGRIKKKK